MITIKTLHDARSAINFLSRQKNMIFNSVLNSKGYEIDKQRWNGNNNYSKKIVKTKLRKIVKFHLCSDPVNRQMQEAVRLFIEELSFNCGLIGEEERKRNEKLMEHAREYAMITISEYN
jgi:hypothetical protein